MTRPITLAGFNEKFANDPDPWQTFTNRDEARKRAAIVHALGSAIRGRVLELAAGNGSNSVALARKSLRLDATEGTAHGLALIAQRLNNIPRARASMLVLPARFPAYRYEAIVVAEVLYYLSRRELVLTAQRVAAALPLNGRLVLAHHQIDYPDFVQHAGDIQRRFLTASGVRWSCRTVARNSRWRVIAATRV